jgi:hypothetical protein
VPPKPDTAVHPEESPPLPEKRFRPSRGDDRLFRVRASVRSFCVRDNLSVTEPYALFILDEDRMSLRLERCNALRDLTIVVRRTEQIK